MLTKKKKFQLLNLKQKSELKLKNALCGVGAHECIHYSFFSPSDLDLLRLPEDAVERTAIRIMNPISEELSLMRTTLAASMINAVVRNQKKGNLEGRLFEIGNVFMPKSLPLTEYPDERTKLCVGIFGEKESFYTLKDPNAPELTERGIIEMQSKFPITMEMAVYVCDPDIKARELRELEEIIKLA